jgi:oligopeptidase A
MPPFHALGERLRWSWGVVTHLTAVRNTPELREAHARQQPEVVRFSNRVGQSGVLHQALRSLLEQKNNTLDPTQVRIVETELLSMQHRGVGLKGDKQQAFNRTSERLAALSTSFSNHVLDATQQWSLVVHDRDQLRGSMDEDAN